MLALLLLILLGAFLRIYHLGTESLWYDEVSSIIECKLGIKEICNQTNQPPLYFLILNLWIRLFGTSETALRLPSAIFGIVGVLAIHRVGKTLFNNKIAIIGSFLSATSAFLIYYSQEARGYSLLLLLSALSYLFFIRILRQNRFRDYLLYLFCNVLLAYTHVYGLFIIISQAIYFFIFLSRYKPQILKFVILQVISALFFLPLIWLLGNRVSAIANGAMYWIPRPTLTTLALTFAIFSGGQPVQKLLLAIFIVLIGVGFLSIRKMNGQWLWRSLLESLKNIDWNVRLDRIEDTSLLVLWLFVPIAFGFSISVLANPMYTDRYVICAAPAFYLLIAKGIANLNSKRMLLGVLAIICIVSAVGLQRYYSQPKKEQWRETVQYIEANYKAGDTIILGTGYGQRPFSYYYQGGLPVSPLPQVANSNELVSFLRDVITLQDRAWFVLDHNDEAQIRNKLIAEYGSESVLTQKSYVGVIVILVDFSGCVK